MHSLYILSLFHFIPQFQFFFFHIFQQHKKTTQKDIHLRSGCLSSALKFIVVESLICSFRQWMNVYIFWIVILPHRARLRQSLVKLSPTFFYCNFSLSVYDIGMVHICVYEYDVVIKKNSQSSVKIENNVWVDCESSGEFSSQMEGVNRYKLKL